MTNEKNVFGGTPGVKDASHETGARDALRPTVRDGSVSPTAADPNLRERTIRFFDPVASADRVKAQSGLGALRAIAAGEIPKAPIAALMNIDIIEVGDGRVVFGGTPDESHYNPLGIVHGGFAMTLFDSALGCAIHTKLPQGVGFVSIDVSVRFIRGLTAATGTVRCEARAIHVGRATAVAEATMVDAQGRLLGTASTACAIIRP